MRTLHRLAIAVTSIAFFLSAASVATAAPAVFDTRPYSEAKQAAEKDKKWLIVKGTAVWCGPCKKMDKDTWVDANVVKWLSDNAVAVAVDVDQLPDIAKDLKIEAMPTIIALKDGKEFDRIVGYRGPEQFKVWLDGIAKGEKSVEALTKRAKSKVGEGAGGGEGGDIQARLQLARSMADSGKAVEAADEYVWLWDNMLSKDQAMYGVRLSFMAGDMQRLAEKSPEAKAKFAALRDKAGKALEGEKIDRETLVDWVVLSSKVLDDSDAVVAWYDKVKGQRKYASLIERIEDDLTEMLIARERWADLGRMVADPVATLERELQVLEMIKGMPERQGQTPEMKEAQAQYEKYRQEKFRKDIGNMYAGLLAADRDEVALKYALRARQADKSPELVRSLAQSALDAKEPREQQAEWLTEAGQDALSKELAEKIRAALKATKP